MGPQGDVGAGAGAECGSGDRASASASAPDVQENRGNRAGSTLGLTALALS